MIRFLLQQWIPAEFIYTEIAVTASISFAKVCFFNRPTGCRSFSFHLSLLPLVSYIVSGFGTH